MFRKTLIVVSLTTVHVAAQCPAGNVCQGYEPHFTSESWCASTNGCTAYPSHCKCQPTDTGTLTPTPAPAPSTEQCGPFGGTEPCSAGSVCVPDATPTWSQCCSNDGLCVAADWGPSDYMTVTGFPLFSYNALVTCDINGDYTYVSDIGNVDGAPGYNLIAQCSDGSTQSVMLWQGNNLGSGWQGKWTFFGPGALWYALADSIESGPQHVGSWTNHQNSASFFESPDWSQLSVQKQKLQQSADCAGVWSQCTSACETAAQRTFMVSTPPAGSGTACPTTTTPCAAGEGACPASSRQCLGPFPDREIVRAMDSGMNDRSTPFTTASSFAHCCEMCAAQSTCSAFNFEPSTSVCELWDVNFGIASDMCDSSGAAAGVQAGVMDDTLSGSFGYPTVTWGAWSNCDATTTGQRTRTLGLSGSPPPGSPLNSCPSYTEAEACSTGLAISHGVSCSNFGAWECSSGCQCAYLNGNQLQYNCPNGASC